MKFTKFLLILLFFTLPFIHGKIFPTLSLNIYFNVSGNFEFTKVIFFNIFSGIIFLSFLIENLYTKKKVYIPITIYILFFILSLSTLFSTSLFTSLIGDLEKGHTALMFFNLLGLFMVLKNLDKYFIKTLICTSLLAGIFVSLLAIKELFFPTYDYGELGNRAFGSFGHPNYLAGYLLLLLPFFCSLSTFSRRTSEERSEATILKLKRSRIQVGIRIIGTIIVILGILFSKSIVAIVLALGYIIYQFLFPLIKKNKTMVKIGGIIIILCACIVGILIIKYIPEKLHSFLSRFYIWETTLRIIFSDIKIFLIGGGAETLPYFFDSFKVPQVYIYENFGFTADRPHNFVLNIFYHFGIFALGIFIYFIYKFFKYFKNTPENIALLLFLLFGIIHYFSITSYLLIILIITLYSHSMASFFKGNFARQGRIKGKELLIIAITLLSITGSYYSLKLYYSEILYRDKNYSNAQKVFSHPKYLIELEKYKEASVLEGIISQKNLREQIIISSERFSLCDTLTQEYPSVENYFYCGNIIDQFGRQELSYNYYSQGLKKLPDLWNPDSPYWNNYFIKNTITGNRFFSEKFGNIKSILEKVGK